MQKDIALEIVDELEKFIRAVIKDAERDSALEDRIARNDAANVFAAFLKGLM